MTQYLRLSQAVKLIPTRPSTNTVYRWCTWGLKNLGGEIVKLEHRFIGGQLFTKEEWIDKFFLERTEARLRYFASKGVPALPTQGDCDHEEIGKA